MKNYRFDVVKMIEWLLPYFLFKPIQYAWLQTLLVTVKNRYADFLTYRDLQLANATINSSVNRLTQAIWDNFDDSQTAYIIQNENYQDKAFIYLESDGTSHEFDYLEAENHEPYEFDYLESELNTDVNFIVRIPVAIAASTDAVYAFVSKYVFSGITFTVEIF